MSDPISFSEKAIMKMANGIAAQAENLANELEGKPEIVSGPTALRIFADSIRSINRKMAE